VHDGADYVVIGRQVSRAANPRAAVDAIRHELAAEAALSGQTIGQPTTRA
jgi:orotidine-5'-phosphate decarboxylase